MGSWFSYFKSEEKPKETPSPLGGVERMGSWFSYFKSEEKPKEIPSNKKLPYNCEAILKVADSQVDKSFVNKLHKELRCGVFLNQRKKKYWIEGDCDYNCFMLFARSLGITWGADKNYWNWVTLDETSDKDIEVAHLLNVFWLEVQGSIETANFSPGITYEVVFKVMLEESAHGWSYPPVNLRLNCPDGRVEEHKESLRDKPRGQWIELRVGDFMTVPGTGGEIHASLLEKEDLNWKGGLFIRGIIFRPKS